MRNAEKLLLRITAATTTTVEMLTFFVSVSFSSIDSIELITTRTMNYMHVRLSTTTTTTITHKMCAYSENIDAIYDIFPLRFALLALFPIAPSSYFSDHSHRDRSHFVHTYDIHVELVHGKRFNGIFHNLKNVRLFFDWLCGNVHTGN